MAWPVNKNELALRDHRQQKRVILVKAEQYDPDFPAGGLVDVIDRLQRLLEEVPLEFRDTAQLDFNSVSSYYDSHYCEIEIIYRRPETDEEWEARKADLDKRVRAYETQQRMEFEALKKKFEGKT